MYGELTLSDSLQKVNIEIVGGSENLLFTTIPLINNQPIILKKDFNYLLNFFNHADLFKFMVRFQSFKKDLNRTYYIFRIEEMSLESNKRKQIRTIADIPALIETDNNEFQLCKITDLSKSGARIICNNPISSNTIYLYLQYKNSIKKISSTLSWEMKSKDLSHYGVYF